MILTILAVSIITLIISFIIVEKSGAGKLNSFFTTVGGISFISSMILGVISLAMGLAIIFDSTAQNIKDAEIKISVIENQIAELPDNPSNVDVIKLQAEYLTAIDDINELYKNYNIINNAKWWLYFGHND